MLRTRLLGVVAAVAAATLTVPTLAPTAGAAARPKVPTIAQVQGVFPHLAGGSVLVTPIKKVYGPAKKCGKTTRIKGASGTSGSYTTADFAVPTAVAPTLLVTAYRLPSPAAAKKLLASAAKQAKKCPGGGIVVPGIKDTTVTKFKTKLGNTSEGYTVTITTDSGSYVSNVILVRKGKTILNTVVTSMDGQAPAVSTSIKAAQVALKTAG